MPNTVVHRNVRLSQISLPDGYSGLRPTACYVCNTGWGHSYTGLGLCQKKWVWADSKPHSIRLASSGLSSRDFAASTVRQTTKTDDLLKNTEIQKIMAWNPIYSMKTDDEMFQEIVVRNNLGNDAWTVGNKDKKSANCDVAPQAIWHIVQSSKETEEPKVAYFRPIQLMQSRTADIAHSV